MIKDVNTFLPGPVNWTGDPGKMAKALSEKHFGLVKRRAVFHAGP